MGSDGLDRTVISESEIEESLREQIARSSQGEFKADEIPVDAALLDEAFIDSIHSVKFLAFIEEEYGVRIKAVALVGELASLRALVEHIHSESTKC